jgi:HEAT repeat protein
VTFLLALSLAAAGGVWPGPEESPTSRLMATDLVSPDPGRRVAAIIRLGSGAKAGDLLRITPFLDGGDVSLRLAAARVLIRAGEPTAVGRVAAQAADERAAVRFEALTLLREAAVLPDAGRHAAERALSDADPAMRLVALEVLIAHPGIDSVPIVAGSLGDGNREVRLAALRLLGLSRDGRAILPLLERIDVADRNERLAVIDALGSIGAAPAAGLQAGPALERQLGDSNDDVRGAAIDALAKLRFAPAVPALRAIATRVRDALARRAILALGAIADRAAIDTLVGLLRKPAPAEEVVLALRLAGAAAIKPVAAILPEAYPTSAAAAATILAGTRDRAGTAALVAVVKARPLVAVAAAYALATLRDPDAVPGLMEAVRQPKYAAAVGVREACLRALAAIGDNRAAGLVQAAAEDKDPDIRTAALQLATVVRGGISRETLAARLVDRDPAVRRAAIAATAALPILRPATLLLDAVGRGGNAMPEDLDAIADVLASVATESDAPVLWSALERSSGPWQVALLRSLGALPGQAPPSTRAQALLVAALVAGGAAGRAAAEILSGSSPTAKAGMAAVMQAIIARLPAFESATRARLCPALAHLRSTAGDAALADRMDRDPDVGVRAAAAWAARGRRASPAVAAALDRASRSAFTPIAQNAMAALGNAPPRSATTPAPAPTPTPAPATLDGAPAAAGEGRSNDWARIRLLTPDRGRAPELWVRIRAGAFAIWVLADDRGEARLSDLPPGPLRIAVAGSNLAATATARLP